ncbi:hypothetical protein KUCAC02_017269 [Chaenocephalus aceratus]|uniref:Uncharacterized protein n=1 Tax=Chaenocephalus aceratus TaxID=36190 RepID=A0ACB9W1I0_CHAAC|nr:hypothetical protein KUCAC02_017269 [Chaenocephalus aceratus]
MIVQEVMESANSVLNASADNSEEVYRRVTPPNRLGVMRRKSWQPETTDTGSIQTSHRAGSVHSKASGTGSVQSKASGTGSVQSKASGTGSVQSKALSTGSVQSKASGLSRGSEGSFVIETEAVMGIIIKEICGIEEPLLDNMKDTEIEVLKSDTSEWIKSISGDIL